MISQNSTVAIWFGHFSTPMNDYTFSLLLYVLHLSTSVQICVYLQPFVQDCFCQFSLQQIHPSAGGHTTWQKHAQNRLKTVEKRIHRKETGNKNNSHERKAGKQNRRMAGCAEEICIHGIQLTESLKTSVDRT